MERRTFLVTSATAGIAVLPGCGGGQDGVPEPLERPAALASSPFAAAVPAGTQSIHTPLLNGAPGGNIVISGNLRQAAPQTPIGVRFTVNPGDDVVAATRLMSGGPEVLTLNPGDTIDVSVSANVSTIYLLGVGAGTIPVNYAGGSFIISQFENDIADALRNLAKLTFIEPAIQRLRIGASAVYDAYALTVWVMGTANA